VCTQGQKYAYSFHLRFNFTEDVGVLKKQDDRNDMLSVFDQFLLRELMDYYKMTICSGQNPMLIEQSKFYQWMKTDCEYEAKKRIYMTVYDKICGKETEKQKRHDMRAGDFDAFYKECINGQNVSVHCRGLQALC
jgi:hypothetical protein